MVNAFKNWLKQLRHKLSWLFFGKVFAGLFIFYLLLSYFAIDPIVKKVLPSIADKSLDSSARVKRVEFDPFRLKATIHDFNLASKSGAELVSFQKLIVDFELSGIFDLAWKFKQIGIAEPKINVAISPSGELNWDALIKRVNEGPTQPPSDTIPSVIIEHIIVSQGNMHYLDANRPVPIDTTLAPLNFQLKGFSTVPKDRGEYLISAAFSEEGGILKWKGDMGVNPVASTGVISVEGVKIAEALQLVKGLALPVKVNKGEAQTSFQYDFSMPNTVPTIALTNITMNITEMAGEMPDGGELSLIHAGLIVPRLDVVKDKQLEMHLKQLDFKLLDFNVSQADGSRLALKESVVTLPQLDFSLQDDVPQLIFNDLNLKFSDLQLHQGKQLHLAIPSSEINTVNLDLAKNSINIKDIVIANINFGPQSDPVGTGDHAVKPIATLETITLADGQISLADKTVSVQSVLLSGLNTSVIKNADNSLNWIALFNANEMQPSAKESLPKNSNQAEANSAVKARLDSSVETETANIKSAESVAWSIKVPQVALKNANVHIQDNSAPSPVLMDVQEATIELNDVSLDMTKPLPFKAAFNVKQGGQFSASGQLWPSPFKADFGLQLSKLSLKTFAPYLNQFALLKLNQGSANVSGKLNLTQQEALKLDFNGKFDVTKLAVIEEAGDKPFLSWNRLGSDNLKLSLMPIKLHMGLLKIDQPATKFIIYENKTTNLSRILRTTADNKAEPAQQQPEAAQVASSKESAVTQSNDASLIKNQTTQASVKDQVNENVKPSIPSKEAPSAAEAFPVSIDAVRVNQAKLEFADLSLTPQFGTNIHSLNGVINGLSTKVGKVAQVEMEGKVDAYGSAKISGSLQPFSATEFTDIKLAFTNLDMSRLTPYSGKFAGRYIDSGKLSVDLEYKIKQQQLVGENKFVINKLKLGEKVESDDAADLPLDLAIAILEDSDGVIDLDLPIKGSLDNPEFSFASIAWKAFRNVLTKVVTAPFRALGKLFGGNGENFDGIVFDAGISEVSPPELEKLAKISEALAKRKGLSLGIVPSYSLEFDTQAIKEERYRRQVIEEMDIELEAGQKPGPIDLGNEDVQDAVDTLYNDLTNKGLFKRLASKFEEPEEGHYEKAQSKLIDSIEVTEADLRALAEARGEAIKAALLANGVAQTRLSVADVIDAKVNDSKVTAELTLDVKKSSPEVSPESGR